MPVLPCGVGAEHRPVAQQVDAPRHAARDQLVDALQRLAVERDRRASCRPPTAGAGCSARSPLATAASRWKRAITRCASCSSSGRASIVAQLGLADQDDLQQLALVGLEVGRAGAAAPSTSAERFCASSMISTLFCPTRVVAQQELVERVDVGPSPSARRPSVLVTVMRNSSQTDFSSSSDGELGVEDVGDVAALRASARGSSGRRWSCRRRLAEKQNEAAAAATPVEHGGPPPRWRFSCTR